MKDQNREAQVLHRQFQTHHTFWCLNFEAKHRKPKQTELGSTKYDIACNTAKCINGPKPLSPTEPSLFCFSHCSCFLFFSAARKSSTILMCSGSSGSGSAFRLISGLASPGPYFERSPDFTTRCQWICKTAAALGFDREG